MGVSGLNISISSTGNSKAISFSHPLGYFVTMLNQLVELNT
jgi:hypothetical protein